MSALVSDAIAASTGAAVDDARAAALLAAGEKLLSVSNAVRWLELHGVSVHENTVRHWYKSGRIQIVRRSEAHTGKHGGRRAEVLIALETLERIACCPFCASRG